MVEKLQDLRLDEAEIDKLISNTTRSRVREILQRELNRIKGEIDSEEKRNKNLESAMTEGTEEKVKEESKPKVKKQQASSTKITSYAWDQSPKFVKIYITLQDVESLPKERISAKFTSKTLDLSVLGLNGKNYHLQMVNLLHPIVPDESSVKVKSGNLAVLMRKQKEETWSYLTVTENLRNTKTNEAPKFDDSSDPGKGLMDLMKKMYDEGDDEMKRTIAKAWTESREKQTSMDSIP